MGSFIIFTAHKIFFGRSNQDGRAGHMTPMGETRGAYGYWYGTLMERENLVDVGVGVNLILEWILKKSVGRTWAELMCLRTGTGGWIM
jgi:hypothetical protein